jgi:DNA-directed RNA polymerase alpha subunit
MNPQVELGSNKDDILTFTLSGVNMSLANAIRRTLLSDIPIVVFRTAPYEENKANILANTSRLNNEIVKQRLSCIPIHIKDLDDFPLNNYIMEVNVENTTESILFVTTKDFTIKEVATGAPISESKVREIFPADDHTGHFIDFVRLRPKISDELPGERIHLTCEFDIGTAKEDGMFNSVATCSYGFTVDEAEQTSKLEKLKQTWKDNGKTQAEIDFESENWKLLDGKRIVKKDSFDFILQTVGVYSNNELLDKACELLLKQMDDFDSLIEKDEVEIKNSETTMSNSFDVILQDIDYTIGKVIEYFLYTKFYETKMLTFCGFKKMHPHDTFSIIRVAYENPVEISTIKGHLKECVGDAKTVYAKIKKAFLGFPSK